jgi:hypothetical protein
LYLAPVLLAVDARIEELGQLSRTDLDFRIALDSDTPGITRQMREDALIRAITYLTDTHHWRFSWDPRGLRMTHESHTMVLGVPQVFLDYLSGEPEAAAR